MDKGRHIGISFMLGHMCNHHLNDFHCTLNFSYICGQEMSASLYTLADGSSGDWLSGLLYSASQQANVAVQDQLSAFSFSRFVSS